MKVTPNAQKVAAEILEAFQSGAVPKALALTFLTRHLDSPCTRWSRRNRLIAALRGHSDARGFRQWGEVGRHVRAGERAFYILGPCVARKKEPDRGLSEILAIDETEEVRGPPGLRLPGHRGLRLRPDRRRAAAGDVERLTNSSKPSRSSKSPTIGGFGSRPLLPSRQLGYYRSGVEIGLAVKNLATWTHELRPCADDRLGTLTRGRGQKLDNEVVAELGGAVLLECLGHTVESDRGGAYRYITTYCENTLATCSRSAPSFSTGRAPPSS